MKLITNKSSKTLYLMTSFLAIAFVFPEKPKCQIIY